MVHLDDPIPFVEVLPGTGVILRVETPYPSEVEVEVDGMPLDKVDAGNGFFKAWVANRDWDQTGIGHWQVNVELPPSKRGGPGCLVSLVNVSINPGHTGTQKRSAPLEVRLLQARRRGVQGVGLPFVSGTFPNMVFKGNVADPLAGASPPHAIIVGLTLAGDGIDHTDRWNDTKAGVAVSNPIPGGVFGREVEGAWTVRAPRPSPLSGNPPELRFTVDWASFPPP
jgi:hypothetical protein